MKLDKKRPKVLVIYTGGTIGMVQEKPGGALKPFDLDHMEDLVPELERFNADIHALAFDQLLDSSNMEPGNWTQIGKTIAAHYLKYDGFVVLHGSDTMAYTASALSFMLENLAKPVILTGSQLPIGEIRTDARENLITAIEIAASRLGPPEVCILFDFQLYRGNRASKYSIEKFQAFRSVNYPVLAEAGVQMHFFPHYYFKPKEKKLKLHPDFGNELALLKIFPGISERNVASTLSIQGLKAVILETFGMGNAPTKPWFLKQMENAIQQGIVILDISQCPGGRVELGRYETSAYLKRMGVTGGADLTSEAALTKTMHLLGKNLYGKQLAEALKRSIRGEMTD